MSLNYKTVYLENNSVITLFKAPRVLRRVFFGVYIVAWADTTFAAHISFDNINFINFVTINSLKKDYEFECADIPQGSVFIQKQSDVAGSVSAIEILK